MKYSLVILASYLIMLAPTYAADSKTPYEQLYDSLTKIHYCKIMTWAMLQNTRAQNTAKKKKIHSKAKKAYKYWKEEIETKYPDSHSNYSQAYDHWYKHVNNYRKRNRVHERVAEMYVASLDESKCMVAANATSPLAAKQDIENYKREQKTVTRSAGKIKVNHSLLTDRFLPQGRLLYSDDKGIYFGIYTNRFWNSIKSLNLKHHEIYFRVIAFRKLDRQNRIFKYRKVTARDRAGNTFPGYAYDQSETDFINRKILPAVEKIFPGRDNKKILRVNYYIKGQYYDNSNVKGYNHNIEPGRPEMPIFSATFFRKTNSGPVLPAYSISPYGGKHYNLKGNKGDPDKIIQSRKRLPDSTKQKRRKQLEERITEHEERRITPEKSRACRNKIRPKITHCRVSQTEINCSYAGPNTRSCALYDYADRHPTGYYCFTEDNSRVSYDLESLLRYMCDAEYRRIDDYYHDDE